MAEGIKLTISQLKYFIEVCRWGNITKASQELHISQPSVSASIKELENEFGVLLFQRVNGRLRITEEGRFFLIRAYKLVDSCNRLESLMKGSGSEKKKISIGLTPMIATSIFPSLYDEFMKQYPDTEFEIEERGSSAVHDKLASEEIDVAIALLSALDGSAFFTRVLYSTEFCLCVSRNHPLSRLDRADISDLKNVPLALLSGNTYHSQVLLNRFEKQGIVPDIVLRSNQLQTIQRTVSQGEACTFLLKEAVKPIKDAVAVPLREPIPVDIALLWGRHTSNNRRASDFIGFVKNKYSAFV